MSCSANQGDSPLEEAKGGGCGVVGQVLYVGQAGGVVDRDVDGLPAGAAAAPAWSLPEHALAGFAEAPQGLDV